MEYMDMWPSDHRPILLSFSYELNDRGHGRFYFDKRMIGKDGIEEAVKRSWNIGEHSENQSLMDRLANCRKELSRWKKNVLFNSKTRIQKLQQALEKEIAKTFPTFVAGRLPSDNIVVAHEMVHSLRTKTSVSKEF
ncbi:unnamed protein product, partial [Brassica rapa subsp. trilocularis]